MLHVVLKKPCLQHRVKHEAARAGTPDSSEELLSPPSAPRSCIQSLRFNIVRVCHKHGPQAATVEWRLLQLRSAAPCVCVFGLPGLMLGLQPA